jgi:hypothetical protein
MGIDGIAGGITNLISSELESGLSELQQGLSLFDNLLGGGSAASGGGSALGEIASVAQLAELV